MKIKFLNILFATTMCLTWCGCEEDDYSVNYDINYPVATITKVSNAQPLVGEEVTFAGENLNTASSVGIGAYSFAIKSASADGKTLVAEVPRNVVAGFVTVSNKYKRVSETQVSVAPKFYEAIVTDWPSEIQQGRSFAIKGENMDLIAEVKVNGIAVGTSGSPTIDQAIYSTANAGLEVGGTAVIEVTPKNGEKQTSPAINVVKASDTWMPKQTLMVLNFNEAYTVEAGGGAATCTMTEEAGFFGKAYRVTAASGNGWNDTYCKIYGDNGGKGFDLTAYNDPHITMLINTYGGEGYAQPVITTSAGEEDRHLTGAQGYGDDYKSTTNGWEWRSYRIEDLGFPVAKGFLDKIGVQYRGGNIDGTPFDISVGMVMITDGALNPTVAWDAEIQMTSYETGSLTLVETGSNSTLTGISQGKFYANYKGTSKAWDKNVIGKTICPALNLDKFPNGIWINFLVNTGDFGGYVQPCLGSGWMNLMTTQGYGDDYQLNPTNNEWQWRSVMLFPGEGDQASWDPTVEFDFTVQILGGNYSDGGQMDLSCDYFVFTAAPIDPSLNTDEL